MNKTATAIFLTVLAGCGTAPTQKLEASAGVCVQYNTADVLVSYGSTASKDQTLQDFTKRVSRYLSASLKDKGIPLTTNTCRPNVSPILEVSLDTLESIASTKFSAFSASGFITTNNARMKYLTVLKSQEGTVLYEYQDDRNEESLDDLASAVASTLFKAVARHY